MCPATLLVVEDDPLVRKTIVRVLERGGFHVDSVQGANDGISALKTTRYDLVVSDQMMPGTKGTEFLAIVQKLNADTGRILYTGYDEDERVREAVRSGVAHCCLQKPCRPSKLIAVVRQLLASDN